MENHAILFDPPIFQSIFFTAKKREEAFSERAPGFFSSSEKKNSSENGQHNLKFEGVRTFGRVNLLSTFLVKCFLSIYTVMTSNRQAMVTSRHGKSSIDLKK